MLIYLLMGYTALMVLIALGLFLHNILELSAEKGEQATKDLETKSNSHQQSDSSLSPKDREKLLEKLAKVPFPIRTYCEKSGDHAERIDQAMSRLAKLTRPPKEITNP